MRAFFASKKIAHATHFGTFEAEVNSSGKIVGITPSKHDKSPSVITQAIIDRTYSDTRVKYPCVRKSYLDGVKNGKSVKPELRGREEFVRVSWDEAIDLALNKLKSTAPENIYNASYGG